MNFLSPGCRPKLIAVDMDGTLLDADGSVPETFWPLLERARELGVIVAPASGRQLASLRTLFGAGPTTFMAENGTVVFHQGRVVSTSALPTQAVLSALEVSAGLEVDHDIVVCAPDVSFVHPDLDPGTLAELEKYYYSTRTVDSLAAAAKTAEIIKVAVYCPAGTEEHVYPAMARALDGFNVAVSGPRWLDVMAKDSHKGRALVDMCAVLEINLEDTVAIGDYLNDAELLDAAGLAIAMGNAHPDILARADWVAPPNSQRGAITALEKLLN